MDAETSTPTASAPVETPETPWYSGIAGEDGKFSADWHQHAPEEERGKWEPYKDATDWREVAEKATKRVSDSQAALHKARSKGMPERPQGEAATPEAMAAYYEAKGLPKEAKEYGITKPEGFPDELWNNDEADEFQKVAHELELTPAQVKALAEWQQGRAGKSWEGYQAQQAEQERQLAALVQGEKETLGQMWGVRSDTNLKNLAKITGMDASRFDPNSPQWIGVDAAKAMFSLYSQLPGSGDPTRRAMGTVQGNGGRDRAYWQSQKSDSDDLKAVFDVNHPRHRECRASYDSAYAVAEIQNSGG